MLYSTKMHVSININFFSSNQSININYLAWFYIGLIIMCVPLTASKTCVILLVQWQFSSYLALANGYDNYRFGRLRILDCSNVFDSTTFLWYVGSLICLHSYNWVLKIVHTIYCCCFHKKNVFWKGVWHLFFFVFPRLAARLVPIAATAHRLQLRLWRLPEKLWRRWRLPVQGCAWRG